MIAKVLTDEADKFKPVTLWKPSVLTRLQMDRHNGTSFDSKIIKEIKKLEILQQIDFPILRFFKHHLKGEPSYSQPIYKSIFNGKYMAHHALQDAKAFHKMLVHVAVNMSSICLRRYRRRNPGERSRLSKPACWTSKA